MFVHTRKRASACKRVSILCDSFCNRRNLYWADSGLKRLEVAMLDGRYRKQLVKTELGQPSAVAVNPRLGYDRRALRTFAQVAANWKISVYKFIHFTPGFFCWTLLASRSLPETFVES